MQGPEKAAFLTVSHGAILGTSWHAAPARFPQLIWVSGTAEGIALSHKPKRLTTWELTKKAELSILRSRAWLDVFREKQRELAQEKAAFAKYVNAVGGWR